MSYGRFFILHWKWANGKFVLFRLFFCYLWGVRGLGSCLVFCIGLPSFLHITNSKTSPEFPIMEPSGVSRVDIETTFRLLRHLAARSTHYLDRRLQTAFPRSTFLRFLRVTSPWPLSFDSHACSPWTDLGYLPQVRSPSLGATSSATMNLVVVRHARSSCFRIRDRLKLKGPFEPKQSNRSCIFSENVYRKVSTTRLYTRGNVEGFTRCIQLSWWGGSRVANLAKR